MAIASVWAALAVGAMVAFFQGEWSGYVIPLALLGSAVFLLALRWQTVPWLQGGPWKVAWRATRTVAVSCLGLFALCTAAAIGITTLSGCPIMGDPGASVDFRNDDSVALIVYPEGVEVPSARTLLDPNQRTAWSYMVSCGSARRNDQVWRTIGAEYAGAWVYCHELTRGELDHRPLLLLRRGDLECTPTSPPAGPP